MWLVDKRRYVPLIWQMLQELGWFEAGTVLCNQALANEQFPFTCEISLSLFAVRDAGSGEGASSPTDMHANASPWYKSLLSAPQQGPSSRHKSSRRWLRAV